MRPANIITAWCDILAGFAVTEFVFFWLEPSGFQMGLSHQESLLWLILSTTGLYGGGIVFNDVFDAKLDAVERPERPIPSGRASFWGAVLLGVVLLLMGIVAGFMVSPFSGKLAIVIAVAALHYNKIAKHHSFIGPLNMGICRGLNLMLGMSAAYYAIIFNWFVCLSPIIFISAITMISRSEVKGGNQKSILLGGVLFIIVIAFIISISFYSEHRTLHALLFLALFGFMVFKPLLKAFKDSSPKNIRASVRGGILGLIPMNAAIAAGYSGIVYGLLILLLLPLSILLAKKFAVT